MMLDWNDYHNQVLTTIAEIGRISPDIVRGYRTIAEAGSKTSTLDAKTRELISIAVAVTRQCDGCIVVHTDAALKHGATREEVVEALGVAVAINAGAALVHAARVVDAHECKGRKDVLNEQSRVRWARTEMPTSGTRAAIWHVVRCPRR